jgi:DNA polymerase-3 subunit beta
VRTEKTKASFSLGPHQDFPAFPTPPDAKKKLDFEKIKDAIIRTAFSASNDEGRPILTGIRTRIGNDLLSLAATDGYRLSKEEVSIKEKEVWESVLPAQSLLEVVRVAQDLAAKEISFSVISDKNQVVFYLPQTQIFTRLIDGEFPNIEKIIPDTFKTKAIINKDDLLSSVKTTSIFARGAANIIKLKINGKGINLSANTPQVGQEEDFVEAKTDGEEMETAFNYRFLLDLLNNFPEKELVFESAGPLSPGVFKPVSDKTNYLHIIMPVRVQS